MRFANHHAAVAALLLGTAAPLFARVPAPPGRAEAEPPARVLNVKGSVEVRHGGSAAEPASLLTPLQVGDVVRVKPGGAAEVGFPGSGARFALSSGSAARVTATGLVRQSGAAPRTLRRLALPKPAASFRRFRTTTPKGNPYGALRDFPVVLQWTAPADRETTVALQDEARKTLYETNVPAGRQELLLPAEQVERGRFYVWTAAPAGESKPASIGFFRVLLPQEKTALEFLERETSQERASNPENPSPLLLLAQTYERFGMYSDAMTAYQGAAQLRPNDTGLQDAMKRLSF